MSPRLVQAVAFAAVGFAVLSPAAHASTWSAPVTVAPAASGDNPSASPSVAVDGSGKTTAVWSGDGAGGFGIYSATREPAASASWGTPTKLASATAPHGVRVAVNASGQAVAGWIDEGLGGNLNLWSATRTSSGTWSEADSIVTGSSDQAWQQLVIAPTGATFGLVNQSDVLKTLETSPGGNLVVDDALTPGPSTDFEAFELGIDGKGTGTVVYTDSSDLAVYAATRPASGTWTDPQLIEQGTVPVEQAQVAVSATGRAVAVWLRGDESNPATIRTASRSVEGTWSSGSTIHTVPEMTGVFALDAAIDAYGRRTAAWVTLGAAGEPPNLSLVNRVQASSAPSATPWSSPVDIAPTTAGPGFYGALRLSAGTNGQTIAIARKASPPTVDIEGAVRTKSGDWEPWSSIAQGITTADADVDAAAVAVDGSGFGTVLWADGRTIASRSVDLRDPVGPGGGSQNPGAQDPGGQNPPPSGGQPADSSASDDLPEDPAPAPAAKRAKLAISLYVIPNGKKCPALAGATVDGVRTNLKVKKTKLRKKLACKVTGTVVLKPTVKVGAKVTVLVTAKGIKKKTVKLPATA